MLAHCNSRVHFVLFSLQGSPPYILLTKGKPLITMKVQKSLPKTKQTSKRQQCNDKWFKSNRIPKNSDSSNLSPSTAMAKLEHRASNLRKDKPNLKRLKKKAMTVSFRQVKTPAATERTPSRPLTNGGAGRPEQGSDSDESQDWSSFAESVLHQNGGGESMEGQESCVSAKAVPGRIEEEAFVHCAERDYIHNRTVLVMQQGQVLTQYFQLHFLLFSGNYTPRYKLLPVCFH